MSATATTLLKKYKYELAVLLILTVLLAYKLRFMALGYYYVEAWPYSVAVPHAACTRTKFFAHSTPSRFITRSSYIIPFSGRSVDGYIWHQFFCGTIQWEFSKDTEYCIFSSDENHEEEFAQIKQENKLQLQARIHTADSWCEVYKVVR